MAKRMGWIPTQEENLLVLILIWRKKLPDATLQVLYAWVAAECTQTSSALEAFINAREAYLAVPTNANWTEKTERKKAAIEAMRKFARERIRNNSAMSDAQKQELGVTVPDKEHSPVSVPDAGPESEGVINAREPGVVKVRYLGRKPYGVDWVEIVWSVSDTVITSPDNLEKNDTFSRNPWERIFASEERGKRLYYRGKLRSYHGKLRSYRGKLRSYHELDMAMLKEAFPWGTDSLMRLFQNSPDRETMLLTDQQALQYHALL